MKRDVRSLICAVARGDLAADRARTRIDNLPRHAIASQRDVGHATQAFRRTNGQAHSHTPQHSMEAVSLSVGAAGESQDIHTGGATTPLEHLPSTDPASETPPTSDSSSGPIVTASVNEPGPVKVNGAIIPTDVDAVHVRPSPTSDVRPLVLRTVARSVGIISDPTVKEVEVDGQHHIRDLGDHIEIVSSADVSPGPGIFRRLGSIRTMDELVGQLAPALTIRVNPMCRVDIELTAGRLVVDDVAWLGSVRVTGGLALFRGVEHIDELLAQASQVTMSGTFQYGRSQARLESGQLGLNLTPDSDVMVHADVQWGSIQWPDGRGSEMLEYQLGSGHGHLDISAVMGAVKVGRIN